LVVLRESISGCGCLISIRLVLAVIGASLYWASKARHGWASSVFVFQQQQAAVFAGDAVFSMIVTLFRRGKAAV
jgi:hypothetical protein